MEANDKRELRQIKLWPGNIQQGFLVEVCGIFQNFLHSKINPISSLCVQNWKYYNV